MIDHNVVLYGSDSSALTHRVVPFIATAVQDHGAAIVIASTEHEHAFRSALIDLGVDPQSNTLKDRLLFLNANDVIKGLFVNGKIERARFVRLLANPIKKLAERYTVHAYGELAGILRSMGRPDALAQLELLVIELLSDVPMRSLAGFPSDVLEQEAVVPETQAS